MDREAGADKDRVPANEGTGGSATGMFRSLTALTAVAPLPLVLDEAGAANVFALASGGLLLWWALAAARGRAGRVAEWRRHGMMTLALCLVLAWLAAQSLELAPPQWQHPFWRDAAAALGRPLGGAIGLDPVATSGTLMRWAAFAGLFWMVMQMADDRARAGRLLLAAAVAGALFAAYGVAVEITHRWPGGELGAAAVATIPRAPLLRDDGFALYLGLCLITCLALLTGGDDAIRAAARAGLRRVVLRPRTLLLLASSAVLGTALALARSGVAPACAAFGISVFIAAMASARGVKLATAVTTGFAVTTASALAVRFAGGLLPADFRTEERTAAADAPVLGDGADALPDPFGPYREGSGMGDVAGEVGMIATLAMLGIAGWLIAVNVRGVLRPGGEAAFPALALGAAGSVGLNAVVEGAIRAPGVVVTLVAILAAGFAHSRVRDAGTSRSAGREVDCVEAA